MDIDLFKRLRAKPAEPTTTVDPAALYQLTSELAEKLKQVLTSYQTLTQTPMALDIERQQKLMDNFMNLALQFEKVYEVMRFDLEKLQELQKYYFNTQSKRTELLKQLEKEPEAADPKQTTKK